MNEHTQEKLAQSLTASDTGLIPFLPYLLQDLWELGSSPAQMVALLRENAPLSPEATVLDLACGKGAVSVRIAEAFGCHVTGVDIVPDFIDYARGKARAHGVADRCAFEADDVARSVTRLRGFDCVIWGAAGALLGDPGQTLLALRETLAPGGYILMDDAYVDEPEQETRFASDYYTLAQWHVAFGRAGLTLIASAGEEEAQADVNDRNNRDIARRAQELKARYPEKAALFDGYVQSQLDECDDLADAVHGIVWLLKA